MLRNGFGKMCRKLRPKSAGACEVDLDNLPGAVPDDDAIDREQLQGALDELPPSYRMVVMMFYFEDCSYRQIAEQLDLPMGTVMSRLARAKAHLRSRLFVPGPVSSRSPQRRIAGKRG
jgi:RNA polymerase sigma-70 factor (ECF subfamily)